MNRLVAKLKLAYRISVIPTPGGFSTVETFVDVEAIKQAFKDEGWVQVKDPGYPLGNGSLASNGDKPEQLMTGSGWLARAKGAFYSQSGVKTTWTWLEIQDRLHRASGVEK